MQVVKCNSFVTLRFNCCPCFIIVPCPSSQTDGYYMLTDITSFRIVVVSSPQPLATPLHLPWFLSRFVHFWARTLPKWGKHVAQHGQACCPTWAHFLLCRAQNLPFSMTVRIKPSVFQFLSIAAGEWTHTYPQISSYRVIAYSRRAFVAAIYQSQ